MTHILQSMVKVFWNFDLIVVQRRFVTIAGFSAAHFAGVLVR